MISINKIIYQLSQCKEYSIPLPLENDNCNNKFVQKTAIELRKQELELSTVIDSNISKIIQNYTMDDEIDKINNGVEIATKNENDSIISVNIPSKSLVIYNENECSNLPEIMMALLKIYRDEGNDMNIDEWYLYGVKNPESFYKSFLFLTKVDYILKNKMEKKNEVATFKREMALQYENFYTALEYRKLRLPKHNMVHNLTNEDNYTEFHALQYIADYNKSNYIVLDIINEQYIEVLKHENNIVKDIKGNGDSFYVIVKYLNNTYLPLMNANGIHVLNENILKIIKKNFERVKLKGVKDENLSDSEEENIICNPIVIEDVLETFDISSLSNSHEGRLINDTDSPIIKKNNDIQGSGDNHGDNHGVKQKQSGQEMANSVVKDIILPALPNLFNLSNNNTNNDSNNNTNNDKNNNTNILSSKPIIKDPLDGLLDNIPIKDPNQKKKRGKSILSQIQNINDNQPDNQNNDQNNDNKTNKNEIKQLSETSTTLDDILNDIKSNNIIVNSSNLTDNNNKEKEKEKEKTIKPLSKYTLDDLQMLGKLHKIPIQKKGKGDKLIRKTKEELYNDLQKYL